MGKVLAIGLATNPGGHSGGHIGAATISPIFFPVQKGSKDPKITVIANNNCNIMKLISSTDAD